MVCLISLHFQVKLIKSLALEGMLGGGITSRGDGGGGALGGRQSETKAEPAWPEWSL